MNKFKEYLEAAKNNENDGDNFLGELKKIWDKYKWDLEMFQSQYDNCKTEDEAEILLTKIKRYIYGPDSDGEFEREMDR